jgi:CO/xanthine dehydrogenase Mo-binding subunit
MPVGGGFGGKFVLIEPLLAVIAVAAKRPVRLVLTRMEEFLATNPSPQCIIEVKTGARRDGTLTALQARVVFDTGVYPGSPLQIACLLLGGYYRFPNLDIHGYEVLTNRFGPGAYRAPGAPQATFAIESQLDELARKLGLDPLELRLRNAVAEGDPQPDGTPWPRIGLRECLERLRAHPAWRDRGAPPRGGDAAGRREGVGIAVGGWPGGLEPAAAACRLDNDGRVTVVTGSVDLTGTNTTLALIAAEVLGLRPDQVRVVNGDSDAAPFAGVSGGSKITYTVGAAVRRAAEDARQQILRIAADVLESSVEDLEIVDGTVQVRGAPARALPLAEIGRLSTTFGARFAPVDGRGTSAITANAPGFAAQLARVAVDEETGEVAVRRYVAVQDVGRALNPAAVEGQLHGGVAQGIGWALYERMVFDEDGRLLTASFLDYAVPSATRVPPIETAFVEVPSADGPFGAKGVGEPPVVPGAAAVANAVRDAVGVRVTEIPITPERLLRALGRLA